MNFSDKQLKIFETYENTNKNLAISAAPGSGKTTTLLEILKRTHRFKKAIFLAFNKSIQMELERKVPDNTDALTLHSMGYRTLLRHSRNKFKLNEIKNWILGKNLFDLTRFKNSSQTNVYLFTVSKLVDLYRMNLCQNEEDLYSIADKYNISILNGEISDAMKLIQHLEWYNSAQHESSMLIDYVDMLWLPYKFVDKDKFPKYSVILIDECQDLNKLQFELIKRLMTKRSRFVAVGDPYQAIYAFQGADKDVFQQIINTPNTENLPLSYSYRCGKRIAKEANKVFDFIETPVGHHDGEIIYDGNLDQAQPGDLIVCRNNAPLIDAYLNFLKCKKKAVIVGKDFGKGLLHLLNKIQDLSDESINDLLKNKQEELKQKGIKNYINNESYRNLLEKISILQQIHKEYEDFDTMKNVIESMFTDSEIDDAIKLSTIHKAKGTEADNVYFLFPQLIPSKYAETITEQYAEQCLMYVGITRAKNKLTFVLN